MMRHNSRARVITLAALAAFAAIPGLGAQASSDARADVSTYGDFKRKVRERIARAGGWVGGAYPRSKNGGKRRKSAIRARRMNNSGNGNQWSRKHA